jgi:small redox-active disulfide protein 2
VINYQYFAMIGGVKAVCATRYDGRYAFCPTGGETVKIEVLGPGCAKCQATEANVKEAVRALGVEVEVRKVTDVKEIAGYGVFSVPAVVVDGQVKSVGKIPSFDEIKKWFQK